MYIIELLIIKWIKNQKKKVKMQDQQSPIKEHLRSAISV